MNPIPVVDFKSVFETLPGLYLILTPNLTIAAVSNPYLEATLTKRDEIIGRGLFDVFPDNPEDNTANGVTNLRASLKIVLQQRQPHRMAVQKYDIRKPDGVFEERFWSPLNTPVFNELGEIVYIIHNVIDVTGNQRQKEKLKKTEADLQLLLNSVNDYAIFMIDTNGCIATWNSGAERIKGYTADEITGRSIDVFYTAEDIEKGTSQHNLDKAVEYGRYETEGWRQRKDGTLFWANIIITALRNEKGELYGYSKITRDITEKKKAQEQVEALSLQINQSNDAIYTVDAGYKIKSWNRGAEKLYGFSEEEALEKNSNKLLKTVISQEKMDGIINEIKEKDYWSGELQRKTKNGHNIYVLSSNTTIRDVKGVIIGYTAVSFDITEQKQLRSQVNHLASIVEQSSEAIISRGIDQRMISWNKGAEVLFGYTKEEAMGKTAIELGIIKISEEEIQEVGIEIVQKGTWRSERDFFHKNGKSFFGAVVSNAVKNEEGEVTSMVFIIKDISLHKQLEEQLKKSNEELEEKVKARTEHIIKTERRFRTLTDNSNDVITLVDKSLNVFYRSPSTTRITGWTDEDMLDADGTKNVHPDDREKVNEIFKDVMAVPGKPVVCLLRSRHKNGHYLWMEGVVINLLQDKFVNAIVFNFRDVTERVTAEEKLQASENLFRALIENSNDIITLMDSDFKLLYRSPGAARIMGWTNEDMIGVEATKNIHPDDKVYAASVVKEVIENPAKIIYTKFRMLHKQGHYLWLEGTLTNLLHDQYVKAIVFNFRNITERVEAETKLAASEKRFRSLIENNNDIIVLTNGAFKIIYRSPSAARITGWGNKEMKQVCLIDKVHPDDKQKVTDIYKACLAKPGRHLKIMYRTYSNNGNCLYMEGIMSNLLQEEHVKAIVLNLRDVTERIAAEEKLASSEVFFRSLIENSAEGISLLDEDSNVIYRSPSAYKMLGNSPKEKSITYAHPDDSAMFKNKFAEALSKPSILVPYQVRFLHVSGSYFWAEGTFTNLLHVKGVNAIVANYRDITEKKKAEENIRKSNERFELVAAATNDVIWDWDLNLNEFWVNKNYYTHFGYDEKKTLQDIAAWQEGIHPDDKKRVLSGIHNSIKNQQHFWKEEYRYLKCDKTTAFVMDCGYILYNDKGKAYRMAGAMLDITQRKQAEQELKNSFDEKQALAARMSVILNTLPANIALLDTNGYIIDVNDSWRNFATENGFIGNNYGIGDNYLEVSRNRANGENEDGKKVADGITAVLKKKTAEFIYEYACHSPKVKRWFRMAVTLLQEKEYAGAVVMHLDISELRRLEQDRLKSKIEEQKKIAKAMLIGQEKERNHLGKELHDNINQILASTKMFLAIAAKKNKTAKELIKYPMELVDMSIDEIRMLSHKMVTQLKNINLEKLIKELLEKLDLTTKIKTKFTYAVADGALSDDLKLNIYRIMQELVNNITKYAEAHTVTINVKTNNGIVDVVVKDDGKGFEPEKKQKGIGISNITNRVKSFNGDIIINSAEGKGCVTSITIPY